MAETEDYFANIDAVEPRKRRLSRLETTNALKRIAKERQGFNENWTSGRISFMKTYPVKKFPKWFAKPGDNVFMQVSIRPITGKTSPDAPIAGLEKLEVYYRYVKIIAEKPPKKESKEEVKDEDKTEKEEFDPGRKIMETTDWTGSVLSSSSIARSFYKLIKAIGQQKLERMMSRIRKDKE